MLYHILYIYTIYIISLHSGAAQHGAEALQHSRSPPRLPGEAHLCGAEDGALPAGWHGDLQAHLPDRRRIRHAVLCRQPRLANQEGT